MAFHKKIMLACLLFTSHGVYAQVTDTARLYRQLQAADSLLFSEGFNKCRADALQGVLHKDLQFFHDEAGMLNRDAFLKDFKQSICPAQGAKPIRRLVEGSVTVYALTKKGKLYGAVQSGIHEFYLSEPGRELVFTSRGRFIHTWLLEHNKWQLYRAISYDHRQPVKYPPGFEDGAPFPLFDKEAEIEALVKKLKIVSVSIAYIDQGQIKQLRAYGSLHDGAPARIDGIYNVASLTKPVTALVALKLANAFKGDIEAPLSAYYTDPEVKDSPYLPLLTTRQVLTHRTGFPNWRQGREDKKLAFEFRPGTKFQYSGEGFEYLRKALEARFGKSLEQLAKELVFIPLGMDDTHYYWTKNMDGTRYAAEHDKEGKPLKYFRHTSPNAADNLLTTTGDYSRLLLHIANGGGLTDNLYKDLVTPHVLVKDGLYTGLGIQVMPDLPGGDYALMHTGGDAGVKALAIILPRSQRGIVVLSNSDNGMQLWKKITEEYLGEAGREIVRRNLSK